MILFWLTTAVVLAGILRAVELATAPADFDSDKN